MKKMSSKKMIVTSIAVVTLAGLAVFVGGKLLIKNDSPVATLTPTPIISATPVASPSVSPEATNDPSESPEATATPSAKPSASPTAKPSATPKPVPPAPKPEEKPVPPAPKPEEKPVPPVPKPEEKPVLCSADGANPNLPCDAIIGYLDGDVQFEGDDGNCTQCLAWGYSINPDDYPGLKSFYCVGVMRNDGLFWGSKGLLVY